MPGSEAIKEIPVPEIEAAPVQQAQQPAPAPIAAPRQAKPRSLAPPAELRPLFEVTAQEFGVPANVLMAIAQQESSYNNDATNAQTGAAGMAQYMDATAKSLKINARDPNESIPATAMQIKERLDKGMSLDDAIREHFAGPNRRGWGPKTAAYGTEVLAKAEQIGNELYGEQAPAEQPKDQNNFAADRQGRSEYEANFRALNPRADQSAVDMAMSQYDEQAKARTKAKGNAVQDQFAALQSPEAMFNQRLNAKLQAGNQGMAQAAPSRQQPDNLDVIPARERPGIIDQAKGDFGRGIDNLIALGYGATGIAADALGNEELATSLLDEYVAKQDEIAKTNPATIGTYKNVKSLGDAGRYAIEAVAENLPMLIPSLLSGGVGAQVAKKGAERLVGGMIEAQVAKGVAREVAERQAAQFITKRVLAGSVAGAAPTSVVMEAGSIGGDIYNETGRVESGTAIGYGIPAGLLDTIGPVMALRKVAGPIVDEVAGSVIRRLGVEVGKQFLAEAGTEGLQTIIEQAAVAKEANRDLWTPELLDNVIDAALKGGIGGGVMGGVSQGVAEVRGAMAQPQANQPAPERIEPTMGDVPDQVGTSDAAPVVEQAPVQVDDEGYTAQIMGDDGLMHTIDSRTGVTMTEPPAEPLGPLESALSDAAEMHAADPAPAPVMPEPEPAPPDYTVMAADDLRARVKEIAAISQQDMAQRKQLMPEPKAIEKEIAARAKQAKADSKPAEEPLTAGPFEDISTANSMMMRYAEQTGVPHEVVGEQGSFRIQPLQEQENALDSSGATGRVDGLGRSSEASDGVGSIDSGGREGTGDVPVGQGTTTSQQREPDAPDNRTGADGAANSQPALTTPARNPYQAYSASSAETAEAYMDKRGIDRTNFEVKQTGPVRWQVVPRTEPVETEVSPNVSERTQVPEEAQVEGGPQSAPEAAMQPSESGATERASAVAAKPAKPKRVEDDKSKAIRLRNERQEAAVKKAVENEAKRKAAPKQKKFSVAEEIADSPSAPVTKAMQKLADDGRIVLHDDASTLPFDGDIPAGAQAMTDKDGTIHVVAGSDMAVVLHEAFHAGGQKLIGTAKWESLMKRLDSLYRQSQRSTGKAREFFDAARGRVATAKAKGAVADGMAAEEFGAYAIEEYASAPTTIRKWVDDLVGTVKAWALRRFGAQLGQVSPAQLSALAKSALADIQPTTTNTQNSETSDRFSVSGSPHPRTLTPDEQGILRKVQAQIQDANNRVNQVQARIRKTTGIEELGTADYYRAETNRPGRIAARKEDARDKLFEPMMRRLAKAGYKPAQLEELLHAQHAKERNAAVAKINPEHDPSDGRYIGTQGSGMNDDRADQIIEQYKGERELLALADEARQIARDTLALKKEYGLITDQQYDLLDTAYENYVPLKGDGEYGPKQKRAMGHTERDENILGNIARDYEQAVVVGEKNLARQSLLQMVLQFADDALWTARVPPRGRYVAGTVFEIKRKGTNDIEASYTSQAQVASFLEGKGSEASQYEVNTSGGERVVEFTKSLQDNEVMVYVKGDPVRIQIYDETLARQLRPLRGENMNVILEGMRAHNRYLSMIFTGYNPAFIIKNASRDAITGTINMTGNHGAVTSAKAWAKYPAAWATMLQWAATKKTPNTAMGRILDEYRAQGGKTGASYMSDLEEQGKNLGRMFDDAKGAFGYAKEGRVDKAAWIAARKAIGGLAHTVEVLNQAFENALRLALFAQLRAEGKKPGIAAAAAKAVTVNFDRKGVMTPQLGAFYLFINPAIQGTANMSRTLTQGEHKYQAWALTGMMAAAGFAAAVHGMDDDKDRWLGQSWSDRTKNLRFRIGTTTINIPMSYEFAPFYAIGVAMGEASRGESSMRSAVRAFTSFLDAYYPMQGTGNIESDNYGLDLLLAHIPTVAKVPAQSWLNRNSFGSKVVPDSEFTKNRPDNLKMNRGTTGTAYDKAAQAIADAGEMVGADKYSNDLSKVSPETLKLIYSTYTGGLGRFISDSASFASFSSKADVDLEYNDVPILKDFVKSDSVNPIRSRFYDLSSEVDAAASRISMVRKSGVRSDLRAAYDSPDGQIAALAKAMASYKKTQDEYSDSIIKINADKSLSLGEKRTALKDIEAKQEKTYRDAIQKIYKRMDLAAQRAAKNRADEN